MFNDAMNTQKTGRGRKSVTTSLHELFETLSDYGGETVSTLFDEFYNNLQLTANLARSLSDPNVIDSINFVIKSAFQAFRESSETFEHASDKAAYVTSVNMESYLELVQSKLMNKLRNRDMFSPLVKSTLDANFPHFIEAVVKSYSSILDNIKIGLTFGIMIQALSWLSFLERPEYVSASTFEPFAAMPSQITDQLEKLLLSVLTSEMVEMAHMGLKMYFAQAQSRPAQPIKPMEPKEHIEV